MNFPGTGASVGGAAAPPAIGGPQDPNVKAVRLNAQTKNGGGANFLRNIGSSCDGILFRKVCHVWSDGFRYGWFIRNVHGFCRFPLVAKQLCAQANTSFLDVLRYTIPHSRSRQPAKHNYISPSKATTQDRIQRHGCTIMVDGQELRQGRSAILWC